MREGQFFDVHIAIHLHLSHDKDGRIIHWHLPLSGMKGFPTGLAFLFSVCATASLRLIARRSTLWNAEEETRYFVA
jgi:hypothetical protein